MEPYQFWPSGAFWSMAWLRGALIIVVSRAILVTRWPMGSHSLELVSSSSDGPEMRTVMSGPEMLSSISWMTNVVIGDHAGWGRGFVGVGCADAAALDVVPDGVLFVEVGADGFTADGEFGPALGDATFVFVKADAVRHERRAGGGLLAELPVIEHIVEAGVGDAVVIVIRTR